MTSENPFRPGFGIRPPFMAGRGKLIQQIVIDIRRGPGSTDFHHIVVGPRGTGKTALLAEIAHTMVDEHGGIPLWWTAGALSFNDVIGEAADRAGVPANVPPSEQPHSAHGAVERLAQVASTQGQTVLILVDQAEMASPNDVRSLATMIQELAQVRGLPVSLLAAGLASTTSTLAAATFLERQAVIRIGNLDLADSLDAIKIPVVEAGRLIGDEALHILANGSQGYPYALQLMAALAWDGSGDEGTIDRASARVAVEDATVRLNEQLFGQRWNQMTELDREYVLAVVAELDPGMLVASSTRVERRLGLTPSQLGRTRDRLINRHEVLYSPGRDQLMFSLPGFATWAAQPRPEAPKPHSGWSVT